MELPRRLATDSTAPCLPCRSHQEDPGSKMSMRKAAERTDRGNVRYGQYMSILVNTIQYNKYIVICIYIYTIMQNAKSNKTPAGQVIRKRPQ